MRNMVYLLVAVCFFIVTVGTAQAAEPCCEAQKSKCKKVDALMLSADELEDGKTIELEDNTLTMRQDGDAWNFTLTNKDGNEISTFSVTPGESSEGQQKVKILMMDEDGAVKTKVMTGDFEHGEGHTMAWFGDEDGKVVCKSYDAFSCCPGYKCPECGLTISVGKEKDKGSYVCPNDGTAMEKQEPAKGRKSCSYVFVTDDGKEKVIEVEKDVK